MPAQLTPAQVEAAQSAMARLFDSLENQIDDELDEIGVVPSCGRGCPDDDDCPAVVEANALSAVAYEYLRSLLEPRTS